MGADVYFFSWQLHKKRLGQWLALRNTSLINIHLLGTQLPWGTKSIVFVTFLRSKHVSFIQSHVTLDSPYLSTVCRAESLFFSHHSSKSFSEMLSVYRRFSHKCQLLRASQWCHYIKRLHSAWERKLIVTVSTKRSVRTYFNMHTHTHKNFTHTHMSTLHSHTTHLCACPWAHMTSASLDFILVISSSFSWERSFSM